LNDLGFRIHRPQSEGTGIGPKLLPVSILTSQLAGPQRAESCSATAIWPRRSSPWRGRGALAAAPRRA